MPTKLPIDWQLAESLYNQGFSMADIARKLNCNAATVRCHAVRYNWKQTASKAKEIVQQKSLKERGESHLEEVATIIERHIAAIKKKDPAKLSLADLEKLASIIERINKAGRLTFGLDAENGGPVMIGLRQTINLVSNQPVELVEVQTKQVEG